jgi:hypothetical protein
MINDKYKMFNFIKNQLILYYQEENINIDNKEYFSNVSSLFINYFFENKFKIIQHMKIDSF